MARVTISTYFKNLGKSFGYAMEDTLKEYNPVLVSMAEQTKETTNELYESIKAIKQPKSVDEKSLTGKIGDNISSIWNSFKNDVQTGKIYKRNQSSFADDAVMKALGFDMSDYDFNLDDEDWGDDFSDEDLTKAEISSDTKNTSKLLHGMDSVGAQIANTVSGVTAESANYLAQNTNRNTKAMYSLNQKGFNTVTRALMGVNNTITAFAKIGEPLTTHMQNSSIFFTKTTETMNQMNQTLQQIAKNTTPSPSAEQKYKYAKGTLSDLIFDDGFDISGYVNMIKENLSDYKDIASGATGVIKSLLGGNGNKKGAELPIASFVTKMVTNKILPQVFKDSMKNLNETIKNTIAGAFVKARGKSSGNFIEILKNFFMPNDGYKSKIGVGNYEKGKISWDGISRKALVEVIPEYLSGIYQALTGNSKVFDYERGRFISRSYVKKEEEHEANRYAKRAGGDFYDDVINRIKHDDKLNDKDKARIEKEAKNYFRNAFKYGSGYDINSEDFDKDKFGITDKTLKMLQDQLEYYRKQSNPKYRNRGNALFRNIEEERTKYGNSKRVQESSGISNEVYIRNGFFDQLEKATDALKEVSGDHPTKNTISDFISGIYKNTESIANDIKQIAKNGINIGGKSKKHSRKRQKSTGGDKTYQKARKDTSEIGPSDDDDDTFERILEDDPDKLLIKNRNKQFKKVEKRYKDIKDNVNQFLRGDVIKGKGNDSLVERFYRRPFNAVSNFFNNLSLSMDKLLWGDEPLGDENGEYGIFGYFVKNTKLTFDKVNKYIDDKFKVNLKDKAKQFWDYLWGAKDENGKRQGGKLKDFREQTISELGHAKDWLTGGLKELFFGKKDDTDQAAYGRKVTKTGIVAVSEGELIIPSELNPYYHGITNKKQQIKNERNAINRFYGQYASGGTVGNEGHGDTSKQSISNIANKLKGMIQNNSGGFVELIRQGVSEAIWGKEADPNNPESITHKGISGFVKAIIPDGKKQKDDQERIQKLSKQALSEVVDNSGSVAAGALIGSGVSILTGAVVGPLFGAAIGGAVGLTMRSKATQKLLFGDEDHDGMVPKRMVDFFKKHGSSMGKGAAAGATAGLFMGSPILGAIVGSTVGYIKTSDSAKKVIFGEAITDEKGNIIGRKAGGLLSPELQKKIQSAAPKMALGSIMGAVLGGPFGLVGNMLFGTGLGFLADSKNFHEYLFGDGKEDEGLAGLLKNKIFDNVDELFKNTTIAMKQWFKNLGKSLFRKVTGLFKRKAKAYNDGDRGFLSTLIGAPFSIGGKIVKGTVGKVGDALGFANRLRRDRNLEKGYNVWNKEERRLMIAAERNKLRKETGNEYGYAYQFDKALESIQTQEQAKEFEKAIKNLVNPKSVSKEQIENAKVTMFKEFAENGIDKSIAKRVGRKIEGIDSDRAYEVLNNPKLKLSEEDKKKARTIIKNARDKIELARDTKRIDTGNRELLKTKYGIDLKDSKGENLLELMQNEFAQKFHSDKTMEQKTDKYQNTVVDILKDLNENTKRYFESQKYYKSRDGRVASKVNKNGKIYYYKYNKGDKTLIDYNQYKNELKNQTPILENMKDGVLDTVDDYVKPGLSKAGKGIKFGSKIAGKTVASVTKTPFKIGHGVYKGTKNIKHRYQNAQGEIDESKFYGQDDTNLSGNITAKTKRVSSKLKNTVKGVSYGDKKKSVPVAVSKGEQIVPKAFGGSVGSKTSFMGELSNIILNKINNYRRYRNNDYKSETKNVFDSFANLHIFKKGSDGKWLEVKNDSTTDASRNIINRFVNSVNRIPGLGSSLRGIKGIFKSLISKMFGSKKKKNSIFDLFKKAASSIGSITGLTSIFSNFKKQFFSKDFMKSFAKNAIGPALVAAGLTGKLDKVAHKLSKGSYGDNSKVYETKNGKIVTKKKDKNGNAYYVDSNGKKISNSDVYERRGDTESFGEKFRTATARGVLTGKKTLAGKMLDSSPAYKKIKNSKTVQKASTKVAETAGRFESKISDKIGKTKIGQKMSSIGSKVGEKVSTSKFGKLTSKIGESKVGQAVKKVGSKLGGDSLSESILNGVGKLTSVLRKIPLLSKVADKLDDMGIAVAEAVYNGAKKKSASKLASLASNTVLVAKIAFAAADFTTGYQDARVTLGIIDKPTFGQKLISGLLRVFKNCIPIIGTVIPDSTVVDIFCKYIGNKIGVNTNSLKKQQKKADTVVAEYNKKHGTNLTKEQYIKQVLKDYTWTESLGNIGKTALNRVKGIGKGIIGAGKGVGKGIVGAGKGIGKVASGIGKGIVGAGKGIGKVASGIGKGIVGTASKAQQGLSSAITKIGTSAKKGKINQIMKTSLPKGAGAVAETSLAVAKMQHSPIALMNAGFNLAGKSVGGLFKPMSKHIRAFSMALKKVQKNSKKGNVSKTWAVKLKTSGSLGVVFKMVFTLVKGWYVIKALINKIGGGIAKMLGLSSDDKSDSSNSGDSSSSKSGSSKESVSEKLRKGISNIGGNLGSFVSKAKDTIVNTALKAVKGLKKGASAVVNGVKKGASTVVNGVKKGASTVYNKITGKDTKKTNSKTLSNKKPSGGGSGLRKFISQLDSKYDGYTVGGKPFSEQGCGPAVASMAASQLGKNLTVSDALKASTRYQNKKGVSIDYFKDVLGKKQIKTSTLPGGRHSANIYKKLAKGDNVILLGKDPGNISKTQSPFGPNSHYVLATGLDKNGNVIINDPESNKPITYDPRILAQTQLGVETSGAGSKSTKDQNLGKWSMPDEKAFNKAISNYRKAASPFKGKAKIFMNAGNASGLDPRYILAHAAVESAWGTSNIAKKKHNYFGISVFDNNPSAGYTMGSSMQQGINSGAKWIAKNYYNNKKYKQTTLNKMRFNGGVHEYCTETDWPDLIASIMNRMPKNTKASYDATPVDLKTSGSSDSSSSSDSKSSSGSLDILSGVTSAFMKGFASLLGGDGADANITSSSGSSNATSVKKTAVGSKVPKGKSTADSLVEIAKSQIGVKERNKFPNQSKYNDWLYGKKNVKSSWGTTFISWCIDKALNSDNTKVKKLIGGQKISSPSKLKSLVTKLSPSSLSAHVGDLIFFGDKKNKCNSIGIVESVNGSKITMIQGDISSKGYSSDGNSVVEKTFDMNDSKDELRKRLIGFSSLNWKSVKGSSNKTKNKKSGSSSGLSQFPFFISGGGSNNSFVSQLDSKYKNYKINGQSFADKGCGPAVASMAASQFGKNLSIDSAVNASKPYQNSNGVSIDYFKDVLRKQNIKTTTITGKNKEKDIYKRLKNGQKVILLGRDARNTSKHQSPFGPENHYVLATGLDKNGNMIINDPETNHPITYNPKILHNIEIGISSSGGGKKKSSRGNNSKFTKKITENQNLGYWSMPNEKDFNNAIAKCRKDPSPFKGQAKVFNKVGQETHLDPRYILAHAAQESLWGTSNQAKTKHNYFGIGAYDANPSNAYKMGGSLESGIRAGAKWIAKNYYYGKYKQTSLNRMRWATKDHQYCTDDNWPHAIASIMNKMPKNTNKRYVQDPTKDGSTGSTGTSSSSSDSSSNGSLDVLSGVTDAFMKGFQSLLGGEEQVEGSSNSKSSSSSSDGATGNTPKGQGTANSFIKIARSQLGTSEKPANSNKVKYNRWFYGNNTGAAWCAAFVSWCMNKAFNGDQKKFRKAFRGGKTASVSELYSRFKSKHAFTHKPSPGDIVIYKKGTSHTGLVESVKGNNITTIEGNTSGNNGYNRDGGTVARKKFNLKDHSYKASHLSGFGRPDWNGVSGGGSRLFPSFEDAFNSLDFTDYPLPPSGGGSGFNLDEIINSIDHISSSEAKKLPVIQGAVALSGGGSGLNRPARILNNQKPRIQYAQFSGGGSQPSQIMVDNKRTLLTPNIIGSNTIVQNNSNTSISGNDIAKLIQNAKSNSGVSAKVVEQLIVSLTNLLQNISNNTTPIQQIYTILENYINQKNGDTEQTKENNNQTIAPIINIGNSGSTATDDNIDNTVKNLVGALAAIAKG